MRNPIHTTVLVVDDDERLTRRLVERLHAESCDAVGRTGFDDALQFLRENAVMAVVVDLRLPGGSPDELVAALRAHAGLEAALIGLEAFPDPAFVERMREAGLRAVLAKPLQLPELLAVLDSHLAERGIPARTEPAFHQKLGARLRTLRESRGLHQNEVAVAAGITPSQLSQIERGRRGTAVWTLVRVAVAMRVSLGELFSGW